MADASQKKVGLRTFQDDFQKLNPNASQEAPVAASIPAPNAAAPEHIEATEPAYNRPTEKHETAFSDIDVTLEDTSGAAVIGEQIKRDVAAHTIDTTDTLSRQEMQAVTKRTEATPAKKTSLEIAVDDSLLEGDDTEDESYEVEESDANIIRETKSRNFRLFPAIVASIKGWFGERAERKQEIEEAKPTVVDPATRKERLREAARHSALPTFQETLITNKEKLDADKQAAESEGLTIREATAPEAVAWEHTLTGGQVPSPTAAVGFTEEQVPDFVASEASPAKAPENLPIAEEIVVAAEAAPSRTAPVVAIEEAPVSVTPLTSVTAVEETAPAPLIDTPPITPTRQTAKDSRARFYGVLAGAMFTAILCGGALAFLAYSFFTAPRTVTPVLVESAVASDMQIPISAVNPYTFLEEASTTISQHPDLTLFFYPTVTNNDGDTLLLSPHQLLQPLNTSMDQPFLRSIERIAFGATRDSVPFVVMEVNNFDIAFAGMLDWENEMVSDLAPFLGGETTEGFTDASVDNQDIRRTERLDGTTVLYSFINKNIIIITTTTDALSDIKLLLQ